MLGKGWNFNIDAMFYNRTCNRGGERRWLIGLLSLLLYLPLSPRAQKPADPDFIRGFAVRYELFASLEGRDMTVLEKLYLQNNAEQPVSVLKLRLYPNSYSSDSTRLSQELMEKNGDLRLYFASPSARGRISGLDFREVDEDGEVVGVPISLQDPQGTGETLLLTLPRALAPGQRMILQTPFLLKLPERILDLGYQKGVSYLKDWFIQVEEPSDAAVVPPVALSLYLPETATGEIWMKAPGEAPSVVRPEKEHHYQLEMNVEAMLAVVDSAGVGAEDIHWPDSGDLDKDEAQAGKFFDRLLPGPLASKRPERPEALMAEVLSARQGDYGAGGKPTRTAFLMNFKEADRVRYLSFSPAAGYNKYDQWMVGALVHNYGLPTTPFHFLLAPLYSTGDKTLSGLGRLSYSWRRPFSSWQLSVDAGSYAFNSYGGYEDVEGNLVPEGRMRLIRGVPALSYRWHPDHGDLRKTAEVSARAYLLYKDSWMVNVDDNELFLDKRMTAIAELEATVGSERALYPYRLSARLLGDDQFLRAELTGHYFLNYDAKGNGLQLRGYAGKFFYLTEKNLQSTSRLSPYNLSLSGETGDQDFTYSHYFVGRNEYDGWMSQQMTATGGFFKVSTPYQINPIGQTDQWLTAINLSTDLPEAVNPFALLPFRMPVRVFADFGTYGDLWQENPAAGRFLYDAGLSVSVLKEAVTVYFPLLYSKIYRDTYKSMGDMGTYSKRIRFSIDLGRLLPGRLREDLR